jgi:hypothetical protein
LDIYASILLNVDVWCTPVGEGLQYPDTRSLGAQPDGAQPHAPDEGAAGIDEPPVGAEAPARCRIGREDARLGGDVGAPAPVRLHPEVHDRLGEARLGEPLEVLGCRPLAGTKAGRGDDERADHDLAARLLGEQQEARAGSHVDERHALGSGHDALRAGPAEPPDPGQGPEEQDLVGGDCPRGAEHPVRGGVHVERVALAELVRRGELVQPAPRRIDADLSRGEAEAER